MLEPLDAGLPELLGTTFGTLATALPGTTTGTLGALAEGTIGPLATLDALEALGALVTTLTAGRELETPETLGEGGAVGVEAE